MALYWESQFIFQTSFPLLCILTVPGISFPFFFLPDPFKVHFKYVLFLTLFLPPWQNFYFFFPLSSQNIVYITHSSTYHRYCRQFLSLSSFFFIFIEQHGELILGRKTHFNHHITNKSLKYNYIQTVYLQIQLFYQYKYF